MTDAPDPRSLSAEDAAAALGVSRATLYAYVSRGLVRSEPGPDGRARRYRAEDIETLARRKRVGRKPENVARAALDWGTPVLPSAITLIADEALHYRGRDACALARDAGTEEVARLLWEAAPEEDLFGPASLPRLPANTGRLWAALERLEPVPRAMAMLPAIAPADLAAYAEEPVRLRRASARLLRFLAAVFAGIDPALEAPEVMLARGWKLEETAVPVLRAALILCADHELNASTFAVRVVAGTEATPHGAVLAGLAALQGPRHGGLTERVVALLAELEDAPDIDAAIAARLRRGERIPGFGHPLYPNGDPRARTLLAILEETAPAAARYGAVAARVSARIERPATIDFALAALGRQFGLPSGAPLAVFALGRCIGWLAHYLEQRSMPGLIRPRARYTGPPPQSGHPARRD